MTPGCHSENRHDATGWTKVGGTAKKLCDLLTDAECGDTVLLCDGMALSEARAPSAAENKDVPGDSW